MEKLREIVIHRGSMNVNRSAVDQCLLEPFVPIFAENFQLPEGQIVLPPPCGCERESGSLHRACVKKTKNGDVANFPCGCLNLIFDPRAGLKTTESSVFHPSSKPDGEESQRRR